MKGKFWVLTIIILTLFGVPVFAECLVPQEQPQIVDISSDRTWTIICETSSKPEAEKALQEQKIDRCWVGKEAGEELYRVFCPIVTVFRNN